MKSPSENRTAGVSPALKYSPSTDADAGRPCHVFEVRVRYCEVDRMGVLHHSRYLQLVEAARTESMRASGFPYKDLEDAGFFLVITHADLEYLAPVLYDDLLHIETRLDRISGARLNHSYRIIRVSDGLLCARVTTVLGCVDASGKPRRLPPEILNLRPAVGGSEKT